MFCKSRTRGYFRSKSRNKSLRRTYSENLVKQESLKGVKSPDLRTFCFDFFTSRPEKLCFHILRSGKSKLNEKIRAFEALLNRKNFRLNQTLHDLLCEWMQKMVHKKKIIAFLNVFIRINPGLFESSEVNQLVKVISKNALKKFEAGIITESYKQTVFSLFQSTVALGFKVWTGKCLECLCLLFQGKKCVEIFAMMMNNSLEKICIMKMIKLARKRSAGKYVVLIFKEILFGKNRIKNCREYVRSFLMMIYEASKVKENAMMVHDVLKFLEEQKGIDLDSGILSSIRINLERF